MQQKGYVCPKSDELLKYNPSALVPTLIDTQGRAVFESLVCVDFIDTVSGAKGAGKSELICLPSALL